MATYRYPFANASESDKRMVWNKGIPIQNYSETEWRRDRCGAAMQYSQHGNTNSVYGWEIDHIRPLVLQGSNTLTNLQPLQWENNRAKGDIYPWNCGN